MEIRHYTALPEVIKRRQSKHLLNAERPFIYEIRLVGLNKCSNSMKSNELEFLMQVDIVKQE